VAGLSKEKVEELFWDTITQVRADLAGGVPRKWFQLLERKMETIVRSDSTLPPVVRPSRISPAPRVSSPASV
jgi:hypothetical protein